MSDNITIAADRLREKYGPDFCLRLADALGGATTLALQEYVGPSGRKGYRDTATGRIIYGDRPEGRPSGGGNPPARRAAGPSLPDAPDDDGDARAFAQFYADCVNALVVAGADPEEVIADADEELEGTGWTLAQDRRGFWRPADESHDSEEGAGAEEFTLSLTGWELATEHGVGEVWQGQSGRWFTKRKDGRTAPARNPHAKDEPRSAKARTAARAEKGGVDREKLGERLGKHVGAGEDSPSDYQKGRGRAAARMFARHHGENAAHRVEELADTLEAALAKVQGDDWKAEKARDALKGQLRKLQLTLAELHDPTPAKPKPAPRAGGSGATPGGAVNVPTDALKVDPKRFQYKLNTDSSGVTQELKAVKTFNPDFAGVLSVWKDPEDGETYVVNGHHRHELASRLGHPKLAVRYVQAGSAREARAVGALVNIAEGRGTAIDAAKFMRDMGVGPEELEKRGVSMKGKLAADAAALTRLSDRQFDRLARGLLDEGKALAVARHLDDHNLQDQLFGLLEKREETGKDLPLRVVEEMAREMAETPTTSKTEKSLFGDIESEESLFVPRNEVKAHVRNELARDVNDFLAVSSKRRAERVGGAGNVLDTDKNRNIAEKAGWAKDTFDQLVNRKGAISDAVNKGAEEYSKAKTRGEKDAAKQRAAEEVRRAVQAELGGTRPGDRGGEAPAGGGAGSGEGADDAGRGDPESAGLKPTTDAPSLSHEELQAIADATRTGAFGPHKVFISHAYAEAKKKHPRLGMEDFKRQLIDLNREGKIRLSRADLVEAMDPKDVADSEANHLNGQFHFIDVAPDEGRERTRARPRRESGGGGEYRAPHQKTLADFRKENDHGRASGRDRAAIDSEHRKKVEEAVAGEMEVPPEVLADYPDLAGRSPPPDAQPEPEKAGTAAETPQPEAAPKKEPKAKKTPKAKAEPANEEPKKAAQAVVASTVKAAAVTLPGGQTLPRKPKDVYDAALLVGYEGHGGSEGDASGSEAVSLADLAAATGETTEAALAAARKDGRLEVIPGDGTWEVRPKDPDARPEPMADPAGMKRIGGELGAAISRAAADPKIKQNDAGLPQIPIWGLRKAVASPDRASFDEALRQMWRDGKIRLVPSFDMRKHDREEFAGMMPGRGERLAYVEIIGPKGADE